MLYRISNLLWRLPLLTMFATYPALADEAKPDYSNYSDAEVCAAAGLASCPAAATKPTMTGKVLSQPVPKGPAGRYQIVAKANGLDFAIMVDTETGNTWRLAFIPYDPKDMSKGQWKWAPIETCPDCR